MCSKTQAGVDKTKACFEIFMNIGTSFSEFIHWMETERSFKKRGVFIKLRDRFI
jgi:hypothetical protein